MASKKKTLKTYTVFLPYCPVPDLCSKGHAHLGRCYNMADAQKRLMHHLMRSPAHSLDEGSAKAVLEDTAGCIVEHEEEWDDVDEEPRQQKKHQQQHQKWDNDRKRIKLTDGPAASTSSASNSAPSSNSDMALVQQQLTDLRAGHSEQLRAAYSFVKV